MSPKKLKKSEAGASVYGEGQDYEAEAYNEIEECQYEIDALYKKAREEILVVKHKYFKQSKPYFDKRNEIINRIPNFWVTVFVNHPKISAILDEDEEDCLRYMTKLEVEESDVFKPGYRIGFHFTQNPYFENEVLVRDFPLSGYTSVRWKNGKDLTKKKEKNIGGRGRTQFLEERSLFEWLTGISGISGREIAKVIKDDIWSNPLQYYRVPDTEVEGKDASDDEEDGEEEEVVEVEEEEMEDEGDYNLGDKAVDREDEKLVKAEEEEDMEDEGDDKLEDDEEGGDGDEGKGVYE